MACNGGLSPLWSHSSGSSSGAPSHPDSPDHPGSPDNPREPFFPPPPEFHFNGNVLPNALISRGKPARSSTGQASIINDGRYRWAGSWSTGGQGGWVAIHVGHGEARLPTRVLFAWNSGANYNYLEPSGQNHGFPTSYEIEVSSNSTNGSDGAWEQRVNESGNRVRTRTHVLENAAGIAWVRMHVPAGNINLDEIDVYNVSNSGDHFDSWFFLGDSITAHAFDRSEAHGSFAQNVQARWPRFFPAIVNGGVGGNRTSHALDRLNSALAQHPATQFWAVCLGTNNVGGNHAGELQAFRSDLTEIVSRIQTSGRIPLIPTIPFIGSWDGQRCILNPARAGIHSYNQIIREVIAETGALPGPDLYSYFAENCWQLPDGLHPDAAGYRAMNQLWAEAMAPIYDAQP